MTRVKWLGHAAFEITTPGGKKIYIDPWVEGNPACSIRKEELEPADLVLVTHDHFDHVGEAVYLIKGGKGIALGQPELTGLFEEKGVPQKQLLAMNTGGTVEADGIKITMTHAFHSSDKGEPTGFILTLENGKTIYHAGDTGLFGDMKFFGELYGIDVALLPIGGVFTMDPVQAAAATKLLNPKVVVPMHYRSFPILVQDAAQFVDLVREQAPGVEVVVLDPGQEREF